MPTDPPGTRDRRWHGQPLPPIELPAGQAVRHIALVAPFDDCPHRDCDGARGPPLGSMRAGCGTMVTPTRVLR